MFIPMLFKSRKSKSIGFILLGSIFILFANLILALHGSVSGVGLLIQLIIFTLFTSFILWIWFFTHYRIAKGHIFYRSGPFAGKIEISKIRSIQVNTTLWSGYKPALARKGIIVRYSKYDDIYFSPENAERFVQELQTINPTIEVIH